MTANRPWMRLLIAALFMMAAVSAFLTGDALSTRHTPKIRVAELVQSEKNGLSILLHEPLKVRNKVCTVRIAIEYSPEITEHKSGVLTVIYDFRSLRASNSFAAQPSVAASTSRLDRDTTVALAVTEAFSIAPDKSIKRTKSAIIPVEYTWTYTPKLYGDHLLLVDLSDIVLFLTDSVDPKVGDSEVLIDGEPTKLFKNGTIELPVTVTTDWGVSPAKTQLIGWAFAFVAFVLSYPVLIEWLKSRFIRTSVAD